MDDSSRIDSALIAIGKTQSAAERTEKIVEGMASKVDSVTRGLSTLTDEVARQGKVQAEQADKLREHDTKITEIIAGVHHRPRAPSFTTEVRDEMKATHDSVRAMAVEQAPLLLAAAAAAPMAEDAANKARGAAKKSNLAAIVAGLGAIATLITTILNSCHH